MTIRKIIFVLLAINGCGLNAMAQKQGITFHNEQSWEQVIQQAKTENKLIFLDCYTSWCVPCKVLSENVFTQEEVGRYFNDHFINARMDMEKDKNGAFFIKKYAIVAYPSLLFIDPKTGVAVHKIVGSGTADWLLKGASTAGDSKNNLAGMQKRYDLGERSESFLKDYLQKLLSTANSKEEQRAISMKYLIGVPAAQLASPLHWDLFRSFCDDPLSQPFRRVMAGITNFYAVAGKESVDNTIDGIIKMKLFSLAGGRIGKDASNNEAYYQNLLNYLKGVEFPGIPAMLGYLYLAQDIRTKNYPELVSTLSSIFENNIFHTTEDYIFLEMNLPALLACKDPDLHAALIEITERRIKDLRNPDDLKSLQGLRSQLRSASLK